MRSPFDIVREAADEGGLCCKSELQGAFGQSQFRFLALADIDRHVYDADDGTCTIMQRSGARHDRYARAVRPLEQSL